jgi:hypothetical protein
MGRPIVQRDDRAPPESEVLVVRLAEENRDSGYRRIQGRCPIWGTRRPAAERRRKTTEGVSEPTLGSDRGHGLLHRRIVDPSRAATINRSILHRFV